MKDLILGWVLTGEENYSGRRSLNGKNIGAALIIIAISVVVFWGYSDYVQDKIAAEKKAAFAPPTDELSKQNASHAPSPGNADPTLGIFNRGAMRSDVGGGRSGTSPGSAARSHNADQVIRRGENGTDPESALPMGFGVPVKLVNSIQSGQTGSPVIAEVIQDVMSRSGVAIPGSTRAIGQSSVDESSHRIQIHFHTLVYPEGDQHAVTALGMMPDGSAGLDGDYHSGSATRQFGRFLGTFIGGMAQGMTDRESGGMFGQPYEVGSVRNGLLNGVTQSAQDQTKIVTDDLSGTKPTMSLPSGQNFILYLEKEYQP